MRGKHTKKLDKTTTIILLSGSKSGAKTLHIPKWTRYPLILALLVTFSIIGSLTYQHITYVQHLETEYATSSDQITELQTTITNKDVEIDTLELTTSNQEKMLKQVNQQAQKVAQQLNQLEEDKTNIEERLDSSKKTTSTKPTGYIETEKESSLAVSPNQPRQLYASTLSTDTTNIEASQIDTFATDSQLLYEQLLNMESEIALYSNEVSDLSQQADVLIPYWDAYPSGWPTNGRITSYYGWRQNPTGYGRQFHRGLDIKNYRGANIVATGAGVVVESTYNRSYGYVVTINHGYGFRTRYAHNSKNLVKVGDKVQRGTPIALIGSTGNSTGPHVHYEVRINNRTTNPKDYLR